MNSQNVNQQGAEVQENLDGSGETPSPAPEASALENWIPGPSKPFNTRIDFTRPVRTSGRKHPVRILAIDWSLRRPIIGVIDHEDYRNEAESWYPDGSYSKMGGLDGGLSLENYTPKAGG